MKSKYITCEMPLQARLHTHHIAPPQYTRIYSITKSYCVRDHGIYLPGENDVGQQEETAQPEKDKQSEGKKKSPIKDVKSTEIKLISTNQKEILDEQAQDSGTEDMMKMDIDEDIELVKDEPITLSEEEENGFRKTLDDLTRETLLRKAMVQEEKRLIDIKSRVTEQLRRKERDVETLNSELQSIIKYIDSRSPLHALLASSDQVQDAETRDRKTSEGEIEEDDNVGSVNTSAMQSSSKNKTDDAIQVD